MITHAEHNNLIDMDEFRSPGVIVLSGRPKGAALRHKLGLNEVDKQEGSVRIKVPNEIVSLNSSFFLGLFADSVKLLGRERFLTKYVFDAPAEIREDVEDGVRQALDESNPIPASGK